MTANRPEPASWTPPPDLLDALADLLVAQEAPTTLRLVTPDDAPGPRADPPQGTRATSAPQAVK
jgi:hypothetical protein